jgi:cell wall assembly regulator SMI1
MSLSAALDTWDRMEATLGRLAPAIVASFCPAANWDQLLRTEQVIGEQLPDFIRAAYLRHNGQVRGRRVAHYLFMPFCDWLDLGEVAEFWKEQREANDDFFPTMNAAEIRYMEQIDNCAIRSVSYHRGHVPIGSSWAGSDFFVDLDPAALGVRGQVFHGAADDFFPRKTDAISLETYIQDLIDRLTEGSVVHFPDRGLINPLTGNNVYSVAAPPTR